MVGIVGPIKLNTVSLSASAVYVSVLVCVPALWMWFGGPDGPEQSRSR